MGAVSRSRPGHVTNGAALRGLDVTTLDRELELLGAAVSLRDGTSAAAQDAQAVTGT
ncbi:MAG: hypothetical protein JWO36_1505 [Myxococcales bacterium]|nr:hypothetical protein [Myxococcales bacterium]